MPKTLKFLAIDFGAESGRGVVGLFDGSKITLEEVHRFVNGPISVFGNLHWDLLGLFNDMKQAISLSVKEHGADLQGIGVDTWGVDFGLVGRDNTLVGNPYHYRDPRTDGMMEEAFSRVSREEIFERTGIQFLKLNTVYQLLAMVDQKSPLLEIAETLLMMPDLFNFLLTGRKASEFSIATTSQFFDPREDKWSRALFHKLGLPFDIMPEVIPSGTVVGELLPSIAEEVGLRDVSVIAPACHDTGSAVGAVPGKGENWAYISSGTWSLMGVEIQAPIINSQALDYNFTNEGGVNHTFRFLKNIMGLWLVQECRRIWEQQGETLSYDELTQLAAHAEPFVSIVEPDHESFMGISDMPARIREFCERTEQPLPNDKGAIVRCALESLALKYRWTLEKLEEILGRKMEVIHIVGGGTQNELLSQFTANATGRPVLAGPIEATAIGNIMTQALAHGYIGTIDEAREVIRNSFDVVAYEPKQTPDWDAAYERFLKIME